MLNGIIFIFKFYINRITRMPIMCDSHTIENSFKRNRQNKHVPILLYACIAPIYRRRIYATTACRWRKSFPWTKQEEKPSSVDRYTIKPLYSLYTEREKERERDMLYIYPNSIYIYAYRFINKPCFY